MNRRGIVVAGLIVVVLAATTWGYLSYRNDSHGHAAGEEALYYCPMHPSVTSNQPKNCPICGMKLVKRTAPAATAMTPGIEEISLSPSQQVLANLQTVVVQPVVRSIDLTFPGRVAIDETRLAQVTAWSGGRIERLFADYTGAVVRRGAAVATIYSPDLYATQQEYLVALANRDRMRGAPFPDAVAAAEELVEASRNRLLLLGMPRGDVERLGATRKGSATTTITSPVSGVVLRKLVVPQQYVTAGQPLFEIADLSTVWVEADVPERELAQVAIGQTAEVRPTAFPGAPIAGTVSFIVPVVDPATRAGRLRIAVANPTGLLKPDMFVSVRIATGERSASIVVPAAALIDRGREQFVWIEAAPGRYVARRVTAGLRSGDAVEITSGLQPGEKIVTSGAFLLDSESQLRAVSSGAEHAGH